jgi:hypothetical protein
MSGDDSKSVHFDPLDDSGNYSEWVIRMEAELIRRELLDVVVYDDNVEGTPEEVEAAKKKWMAKRSKKKLAEARAEIIRRVKDSQLPHMRSRDPMEIWDTLAQVHTARGFATRLALRRKFLRLVKGAGESMSGWIGRVKGLSFKLENIGVVVTDEDRILALTNGLDDSYESFVISLDATPADKLTLEHVVDRLLNEEVRRDNKGVEDGKGTAKEKAYAVAAGGSGSGASGGGPRICWRCGKTGHIKAFCKEVPEETKKEVANLVTDVQTLKDLGTREVGKIY